MSEFAPRLRSHLNSLLTPVILPAAQDLQLQGRKTKRGTQVVSYAEDNLAGDEYEDSDGPRKLTGLRTRREESTTNREDVLEKLTTELVEPVAVQGIWRDWMGKPKIARTDKQANAQAGMPVTLIPIRIDLEIPSFTPAAALPLPAEAAAFNVNPLLPAYRTPDATPAYRLKDFFLWNLHESLVTPDQFAIQMVNELDLPNPGTYTTEISKQIREQLQDFAGVALHPLFQTASPEGTRKTVPAVDTAAFRGRTPGTPATPLGGGADGRETPAAVEVAEQSLRVEASASSLPSSDVNNPDDAYRCIINLSINILNRLYTDKFEWSLLHPPGYAEMFAKQTCADIGLVGEWVPAIAHAMYEAVLRLKKDVCESGGLGAEMLNDAIEGQEAGWRYEPDALADEWEPKIEVLSKEDIERREGDRERQLRRARRETARFSSTTNVAGSGTPGFFEPQEPTETALGRGERSKKKRRFRSLSPVARGATPAESAGFGGGGGQLSDYERANWRCANCFVPGSAVWSVRDGPSGPRTICSTCGFYFEKFHQLPPWSQYLHYHAIKV